MIIISIHRSIFLYYIMLIMSNCKCTANKLERCCAAVPVLAAHTHVAAFPDKSHECKHHTNTATGSSHC